MSVVSEDTVDASGSVVQDESPDDRSDSTDGFLTYTASEAFVQGVASLVNQGDVETMIRAQKQMLQKFEKTNEMLLNCNALSQGRLKVAHEDFKRHVKLLNEMKKDLDYIFRKVRTIKQKLSQQYAAPFAEAQIQHTRHPEDEESEEINEMQLNRKENCSIASPIVEQNTLNTLDTLNVENVKLRNEKCLKKENKTSTTVEYVQMQDTVENGKPIENELIKRVCSIETTNPNDSSDCTSEDTG